MPAALRFPISIALAIGINFLLFVFILKLVTGDRERLEAPLEDVTVVDFVRLIREIEAPRRMREELPEPPEETVKPPPPKEPPKEVKPPEQPPMRMLTPELAPPIKITGAPELPAVTPPKVEQPPAPEAPVVVQETPAPPDIAPAPPAPAPGPVSDEPQFDTDLQAVYKPEPRYPPRALRAGIEGVVTVEFIVTPEGGVRDVKVVKAEPPGVFDEATIQGVTKWKFQPKTVDGKPISRRARLDINFRLQGR
jgi:protein TonB